MTSTASSALRLELMGQGDKSNLWGDVTNTNLKILDAAASGFVEIATTSVQHTLPASDYTLGDWHNKVLKFTGALTANTNVIVPAFARNWIIWNATSGAYTLTVKTSAGTGVTIPQGSVMLVFCDGTNVVAASPAVNGSAVTASTFASTVPTGTAPFTVSSSTLVANLNADKLDGRSWEEGDEVGDNGAAEWVKLGRWGGPTFGRRLLITATGSQDYNNEPVYTSGGMTLVAATIGNNGTATAANIEGQVAYVGNKLFNFVKFKEVDRTTYDVYVHRSAYSPFNFRVQCSGTWTTAIATAQADPGADSATVRMAVDLGRTLMTVDLSTTAVPGTVVQRTPVSGWVQASNFEAKEASPSYNLWETDAAADGGRWRLFANDGALQFQMVNDAYTGAASWLDVTRSGLTAGTATFRLPVTVKGTATVDYLTVAPQNADKEGGELKLTGAGSYGDIVLDNFAGAFRVFTGSGNVFSYDPATGNLSLGANQVWHAGNFDPASKAGTAVATVAANGLMSAADKVLLNNATAAATANALVLRDANGAAAVTGLKVNGSDVVTESSLTATSRKFTYALTPGTALANGTDSPIEIQAQGWGNDGTDKAGSAHITFHRPGSFAGYFGLDTDNEWKVGGWSYGTVSYKLYHEGNFNGAWLGQDVRTSAAPTWAGATLDNCPYTGGQLRLKTATDATGYAAIHRQDGANYYILLTSNNDANGTWNALRPFAIDLGTGLVKLGNGLGVTGGITVDTTVTAAQVVTTSNGAGTNIKIGDDAWIGDINAANCAGVKGQTDAAQGYLAFGNDSRKFGYDGGKLVYGADTVLHTGNANSGLRNIIDNPRMRVAQRGLGPFAADNGFACDRWRGGSNGTTSVTQVNVVPVSGNGGENWLEIKATGTAAHSAGSFTMLEQAVENIEFAPSRWGTASARTLTLSFKYDANYTGTAAVCFRNLNNGSVTRSYVKTFPVVSGGGTAVVTVPGCPDGDWSGSTSGVGVSVGFCVGAGSDLQTTEGAWRNGNYIATAAVTNLHAVSGSYFRVTNVVLEPGTVASPIDAVDRPYVFELLRCFRYYEPLKVINFGNGGSAGWLGATGISFRVPKRAAPSLAAVATTETVNIASESFDHVDQFGARHTITTSTSGVFSRNITVIAASEI